MINFADIQKREEEMFQEKPYIQFFSDLDKKFGGLFKDQNYWNEKFPLIEVLETLQPVLAERIYFLQKDSDNNDSYVRTNALSLLLVAGLAWQLVKDMFNIPSSKESEWFKENFPHWFNGNFKPIKDFIESQKFIYDINTFFRHPTTKRDDSLKKFLNYWKMEDVKKLIKAATNLEGVLVCLGEHFDESGWESDIYLKKHLRQNLKLNVPDLK